MSEPHSLPRRSRRYHQRQSKAPRPREARTAVHDAVDTGAPSRCPSQPRGCSAIPADTSRTLPSRRPPRWRERSSSPSRTQCYSASSPRRKPASKGLIAHSRSASDHGSRRLSPADQHPLNQVGASAPRRPDVLPGAAVHRRAASRSAPSRCRAGRSPVGQRSPAAAAASPKSVGPSCTDRCRPGPGDVCGS